MTEEELMTTEEAPIIYLAPEEDRMLIKGMAEDTIKARAYRTKEEALTQVSTLRQHGYLTEEEEVEMVQMVEVWYWELPSEEEQARAERDECRLWFRKVGGHDDMAIKCSVLGLSFKDEYPELFNEGVQKRARINELEAQFPALIPCVS